MQTLEQQLAELEQFIPLMEKGKSKISIVPIAWHLDHSLRVINSIVKALEESDPNQFKSNFNYWRSLFLTLNFLPRGKGRAPKRVLPEGKISESDLRSKLSLAKEKTLELENLPASAHFPHPMFGELHKIQAQKFIRIHTEHHLKICRDITNS
ncbi:MAG: hypothetical protein ACJAV5_000160 [Vicingaceae bacterium]|jgi:hypothetical protein